MTTERPDSRLGTELGPYHIERVLGRGGMGVVYLAEQRELGRNVALKLLPDELASDADFRARFERESRLAASLDHPNIIPIFEAGELDGTVFLAMRYVEGTDLASRLRAEPALTTDETIHILAQVARALDAAHARGLVHRDVKPANLLLAAGHGVDRADHVYLTDFGLTKQRGSQTGLTRTGSFLGTLEYVAPEQIEGRPVDGKADQYALAAIAVECLTGQGPFPRDSDLAILNAHLHDAPPSVLGRRPELPPAVDSVIARGLAKDPDARYADCQAFVDGLREALAGRSVPRPTVSERRARRVPLLIGSLVVLTVAGAVILGAALGDPEARPSAAASVREAAAPTPPAKSEATATENVFPNEAEQALLTKIPADLRRMCSRGSYAVVVGHSGGSAPDASLECLPAPGTGANEVLIRAFPAHLRDGLVGGFISAIATADGDGLPIRPGECATSRRANGRWTVGDDDIGPIVCYTVATTGDALLWWGYDESAILVRAINQRGDWQALYGWFEQNARFIAP